MFQSSMIMTYEHDFVTPDLLQCDECVIMPVTETYEMCPENRSNAGSRQPLLGSHLNCSACVHGPHCIGTKLHFHAEPL